MKHLIFSLLLSIACKTQTTKDKILKDIVITRTQKMSKTPKVSYHQDYLDFDKVKDEYLKIVKIKGNSQSRDYLRNLLI